VFSLDFPWLGKCCVLFLLDLYIYFGFPLARLKWRILLKSVRLPLHGDTDPIAIVLKFRRGLNATMQDKIAESGTDRPRDNDHQGWYVAARRFDLNQLANEAFRYAS
jgi:hypothetical protein